MLRASSPRTGECRGNVRTLWHRFEPHQPPHLFPSVARRFPQGQGVYGEEFRPMSYAYIHPPRNGEPWLAIDDARLLDDYDQGCDASIMAKRQIRSEAEVLARLAELGYDMAAQPKGRRIRSITWTRRGE